MYLPVTFERCLDLMIFDDSTFKELTQQKVPKTKFHNLIILGYFVT